MLRRCRGGEIPSTTTTTEASSTISGALSLSLPALAFAGALATVAGDAAMHPVDTVKTVQQASGMSAAAAIRSIARSPNGPVAAFYEGVVPYVVADGLSGAVKFAAYEAGKSFCDRNVPEAWIPASRFACAAVAFVACSVVLVPGELLKQRLQAGMYPAGVLSGIVSIFRDEGPRAFFTGYGATLFRDVPYTMLELGIYDLLKGVAVSCRNDAVNVDRHNAKPGSSSSQQQQQQQQQVDELVAAAVTGGLVGFATNPLDVIKTRMMTATKGTLAGPIAATKLLLRDTGPKAFLVGATARVCWLMPFTTIYFGCYELTKRTLATVASNPSTPRPLASLLASSD